MVSEKKRFDDGDKMMLRCLMRRFGWEKNSKCLGKSNRCLWMETFQHCTVKEYKDFAWFLVEELLHPCCAADIQRSHWPEDIHRARNGAEGVRPDVVKLHGDLLQWQAEKECTKIPHRGQDVTLARRVERYLTETKLQLKEKLERAYPMESLRRGSLSMSAEKCPHMDGVPDRGEAAPWRSEFERDLMCQIPGWSEQSLPKESFVPDSGDVIHRNQPGSLGGFAISRRYRSFVLQEIACGSREAWVCSGLGACLGSVVQVAFTPTHR